VIWEAVLQVANERPIFGAGWNAVWHRGLAVTNEIWSGTGFAIYQGHNGYLDFYLQLGLVGLIVAGAILVTSFCRAIVLSFDDGVSAVDWPLLATVALLVGNVTESRFTAPIGWLFLCLCYFYCHNPRAYAVIRYSATVPSPHAHLSRNKAGKKS
jgi:exopolysaccharide production protein ExoQ